MKHLIALIILVCLANQAPAQQYGAPMLNGNQDLILSDKQIAADTQKGLSGDSDAALELGAYYSVVGNDRAKGEYWYRIAAENGDPGAQRGYASLLLQESKENKARAIFWLRRAASGGDSLARDALEKLRH